MLVPALDDFTQAAKDDQKAAPYERRPNSAKKHGGGTGIEKKEYKMFNFRGGTQAGKKIDFRHNERCEHYHKKKHEPFFWEDVNRKGSPERNPRENNPNDVVCEPRFTQRTPLAYRVARYYSGPCTVCPVRGIGLPKQKAQPAPHAHVRARCLMVGHVASAFGRAASFWAVDQSWHVRPPRLVSGWSVLQKEPTL